MKLFTKLLFIVFCVLTTSCITYNKRDLNLSFEHIDSESKKARNWHYFYDPKVEFTIDSKVSYHGNKSLKVKNTKNVKNHYPANMCHFIDGVKAGQKIKLSGYIKTEKTDSDSLGLFISYSNTKNKVFKLLKSSELIGTNDWKKYMLELDVNTDTDNLTIGVSLHGKGTIWVDNLKLEIDNKEVKQLSENCNFVANKSELEWLKENYNVLKTENPGNGFEDLQPLKSLIGSSRIVALGENTHGTSEVFKMKHRLIEFLATEMGYTIFSIEAGMAEANKLNRYILHGKGEPKKLLRSLNYRIWYTDEVLELIKWMRKFNESGKGKIQFTGFDMQLYKESLEIINNHITQYNPKLRGDIESISQTAKELRYKSYGDTIRVNKVLNHCANIRSYFTENINSIKEKVGEYEYSWLIQNINLVEQYINKYNYSLSDNEYRDNCMTKNINWLLKNNPEQKIILWAHNGHIAREKGFVGNNLRRKFGNDYYNIGFLSNSGNYSAYDDKRSINCSDNKLNKSSPGYYEYSFNMLKTPMFFLELKRLQNSSKNNWINKSLIHRIVGVRADRYYFSKTKLNKLYDAIIYIDSTTASKRFDIKK